MILDRDTIFKIQLATLEQAKKDFLAFYVHGQFSCLRRLKCEIRNDHFKMFYPSNMTTAKEIIAEWAMQAKKAIIGSINDNGFSLVNKNYQLEMVKGKIKRVRKKGVKQ